MAKFKKGSKEARAFMARLRSKRKINKRGSSQISMAKRRRGSFRKRARSYMHQKSNVMGLLLGTAEYSAYKIFLGAYVDSVAGANITPFIELGGGYFLSKAKQPMLKNLGNVALVMGAFQLITQYVAPMVKSIVPQQTIAY